MVVVKAPELFYTDKFCKAVTGHTDTELRSMILEKAVEPRALILATSENPGITKEGLKSEMAVTGLEIFQQTGFMFPLLGTPDQIYDAFRKFRAYEEYVHPHSQFANHREYFGPKYAAIEDTYRQNDATGFKRHIATLVDMILHL